MNINLTVPLGGTFYKLLQFKRTVYEQTGTHPVTGDPVYDTVAYPLDMTDVALSGSIHDNNNNLLASLEFEYNDAINGVVTAKLSNTATESLKNHLHSYDNKNFVGILGNYDIIATKDGKTGLFMYGKVYGRKIESDPYASSVLVNSAYTSVLIGGSVIGIPGFSTYSTSMIFYTDSNVVTPTTGSYTLLGRNSTSDSYSTIGVLSTANNFTLSSPYRYLTIQQDGTSADAEEYKISVTCS